MHGLDFDGYQLNSAILKRANFKDAGLTNVDLSGADVSGADFNGATITVSQIRSTKGWILAHWSPVILDDLGLPALTD